MSVIPPEPDAVAICVRIADLPLPPMMSSVTACNLCGARCWLADTTPRALAKSIWCIPCFVERGGLKDGDRLATPTIEQITEILAYLDAHRKRS